MSGSLPPGGGIFTILGMLVADLHGYAVTSRQHKAELKAQRQQQKAARAAERASLARQQRWLEEVKREQSRGSARDATEAEALEALMTGGFKMGFGDSVRRGRDAAIAERKAVAARDRGPIAAAERSARDGVAYPTRRARAQKLPKDGLPTRMLDRLDQDGFLIRMIDFFEHAFAFGDGNFFTAWVGPLIGVALTLGAVFYIIGTVYFCIVGWPDYMKERPDAAFPSKKSEATSTFSETGSRTLKLSVNSEGTFSTTCKAGSASFTCMMDTGATDPVAVLIMDESTAGRSGVDTRSLHYYGTAVTAGGKVRYAEATIPRLQIGPFVVKNAPVNVQRESSDPLVTTVFLRHYKVSISNGAMTISQ
jgi:clan AA aspartic protease (TIGR02281 family)